MGVFGGRLKFGLPCGLMGTTGAVFGTGAAPGLSGKGETGGDDVGGDEKVG